MNRWRAFSLTVAVAALALPRVALARDGLLGWTKDDTLVFRFSTESDSPAMCGCDDGCDCGIGHETQTVVNAVELGGAKGLTSFNVEASSSTGKAMPSEDDELAAWLKEHPLTKTAPARDAPGGRARAEVALSTGTGSWKGARFEYQATAPKNPAAGAEPAPAAIARAYVVLADGTRALSAELQLMAPRGAVVPYWSPDGRFVAWGTASADAKDVQCTDYGASWGPSVELLADKALGQRQVKIVGQDGRVAEVTTVLSKLESQLWAKGVNVVRTGPAQAARDASVVYAGKGFEDQARKVAGLLPGGATVAPLTWKSSCDVVVALGASAAK